jgi:predicted nucleic acid-binding protein
MTLYVDSSALLKRYVVEPDSELADQIVASDAEVVTGRHTVVEVRRNLARLLSSRALAQARSDFLRDTDAFAFVELDAVTCELAASIAEELSVCTLDALHLGCAQRLGTSAVTRSPASIFGRHRQHERWE